MEDKILADGKTIQLDTYSARRFSSDCQEWFPELRDQLTDDDGLLSPQIGTLARFAGDALREDRTSDANRVFAFLGSLLAHPRSHPELENLVVIDFVRNESFEGVIERALELMPGNLQELFKMYGEPNA